ncbi:MAG TPA: diaminopimelate epimerase, partial [Armatimonadetes bacterium]|nr:diaminopimelate epimerase [Armatimonadota bacterium]
DGLIVILPSRRAHFRMRMFNPDGSEAEMCGNGIRCLAKYVFEHGLTIDTELDIETKAGIIRPKLITKRRRVELVRVDMGEPRLRRRDIPMRGDPEALVINERLKVDGERYNVTCVSMGNPHCVLFVNNVEYAEVEKLGPKIERHNLFPDRSNVEFVQVHRRDEISMRVWERGVGRTVSCGTGACAAVVAGALNDLTQRKVTVHLEGGDLFVEWRGDNRVLMTGPAEEVFTGEIDL